jgi:type II secretory pathway pseudopilin PulG
MAILLAMVVVMGIFLMKAAPVAKTEVQRENEAELIYRGEAIARALREYRAKAGRYPQDLDELMKVRPLILRQKYRDPMSKDGEWDYIYEVQPGAGGDTRGLPIIGVHSKAELDSLKVYKGKTLVSDWRFVADERVLGAGGDGGGKVGGSPAGSDPGKGDGKDGASSGSSGRVKQ